MLVHHYKLPFPEVTVLGGNHCGAIKEFLALYLRLLHTLVGIDYPPSRGQLSLRGNMPLTTDFTEIRSHDAESFVKIIEPKLWEVFFEPDIFHKILWILKDLLDFVKMGGYVLAL